MNLNSTRPGASLSELERPNRAARGSIAAQACETCRFRKQKCDEQQPKCGLCQRLKLECRYREPQPAKKDNTLVEILDRLKTLEEKVDRIPTRAPAPGGFGQPQPSPASLTPFSADSDDPSSCSAPSLRLSQQPSPSGIGRNQPYRHASAAHKMLTWPAIQQLLLESRSSNIEDLRNLEQEGSAFIVQMQKGTPVLPLDECLQERPFISIQTQATRALGGARVTFLALTRDVIHRLATAYFDTFNLLYPFMDRQEFISVTLTKVHSEGFSGDTDSIIALLVFALGELAIEGYRGNPTEVNNGRPSGVRGGTASRPPGLALFNEARKRIGLALTECDLENVHMFSLAALYYESCSLHFDCWRLTVFASMACQVLVTWFYSKRLFFACVALIDLSNPINWESPRGDLIKRTYWHCANMETALHLELDLPLTGIIDLENRVGIPSFDSPFCEADHRGNQSSHFEAYWASQVALRRLCANLHQNIYHSMGNTNTPKDDFGGPSASSLQNNAELLTQWRDMLPRELQWPDDDPTSFPAPQSIDLGEYYQQPDPNLLPEQHARAILFSSDLDRDPIHYPYCYDVQVALLRTRYYYAKYIVYRPFIYKALHFPEQMTQVDAKGAAECLLSCLKWPLTLSPTSRRKRLIPHLFCWSQNFLGILLILHMTKHNAMLRKIRTHLCGPRFEAEFDETVELMLDWIRDLKNTDSIALWCWRILQGIY